MRLKLHPQTFLEEINVESLKFVSTLDGGFSSEKGERGEDNVRIYRELLKGRVWRIGMEGKGE